MLFWAIILVTSWFAGLASLRVLYWTDERWSEWASFLAYGGMILGSSFVIIGLVWTTGLEPYFGDNDTDIMTGHKIASLHPIQNGSGK